jgi:hypothetical protein
LLEKQENGERVHLVAKESGLDASLESTWYLQQETLKAKNRSAIAFLDVPPGSRRIRAALELNQVVPLSWSGSAVASRSGDTHVGFAPVA